jgi:hypothetical protein
VPADRYPRSAEKSCKVVTSASKLAASLKAKGFPHKVSLIGFYDDEVGRRHRSKPTILDIDTAKLAK